MAIRADSFSSVDEVRGYTRHLLDGKNTFDAYTRPTLTEIEKFIDRVSAILNNAIAGAGFTPSTIYGNAVAKLACDDWVTIKAALYVELTQRGTGFSAEEGSRTSAFASLYEDAQTFVEAMSLGWINSSLSQTAPLSEGLYFTGIDAQSERADPSDSTREQPLFERRKFDNP